MQHRLESEKLGNSSTVQRLLLSLYVRHNYFTHSRHISGSFAIIIREEGFSFLFANLQKRFDRANMPCIFQSFLLLQRAAPRLSRQFFTCHATRKASQSSMLQLESVPRIRWKTTLSKVRYTTISLPSAQSASPLDALGKQFVRKTRTSFFPETSDKVVAYWLLASAASVFGLVVFGGLTRLTESG